MARTTGDQLEGYGGAKFAKVARTLLKDVRAEVAKAKSTQSKIKSLKIRAKGSSKDDYAFQLSRVQNSSKLFEKELKFVQGGRAKSAARIEALYDDLSLDFAAISVLNEKWEAVFATDVIVQAAGYLQMVELMHKAWRKTAEQAERDIADLKKALEKAEKEKWAQYGRAGISVAWTVISWTVPAIRVLTKGRKIAAGLGVSLTTNAVLSSPTDSVNNVLKGAADMAEIKAAGKNMKRAAKTLRAASTSLGALSAKGHIDDITDARKKVRILEAQIRKTSDTLFALEGILERGAADVVRSQNKLLDLAKRAKTQMQKARDSDRVYKELLRMAKQAF